MLLCDFHATTEVNRNLTSVLQAIYVAKLESLQRQPISLRIHPEPGCKDNHIRQVDKVAYLFVPDIRVYQALVIGDRRDRHNDDRRLVAYGVRVHEHTARIENGPSELRTATEIEKV